MFKLLLLLALLIFGFCPAALGQAAVRGDISPTQWVALYNKNNGTAKWIEQSKTIEIHKLQGDKRSPRLGIAGTPKDVDHLVLHGLSITDEDLVDASKWMSLIRIELSDAKLVTDRGITELSHLQKLEEISLCETSATSRSVNALSSCKSLKRLTIRNTIVPSKINTLSLEPLPNLQSFSINCSSLTSLYINKAHNLQDLDLEGSSVEFVFLSEVGLSELSLRTASLNRLILHDMPHLKRIEIKRNCLPKENVESLKKVLPKVTFTEN